MPPWLAPNLSKAIDRVRTETQGLFKAGARVAIKLHMGERGGKYFLDPGIACAVVEVLKGHGCQPFLFDTPVVYPGGRSTVSQYLKTAASHGYTAEKIGCPIIVSDESVPVRVANFEFGIAQDVASADGLFVLTHVKGHECTGMGGAIKNLGMGAVDRKTKCAMHSLAKPRLVGGCTDCKTCERVCPDKRITILGRKIKIKGICYGCDICVSCCPAHALAPRDRRIEAFIAQAAAAVVKSVPAVYGVNVLHKIVKQCDCYTGALPTICPDIGFVGGGDVSGLDELSLDLIKKKLGKDIFEEIWHKSPRIQITEYREAVKQTVT